MKRILLLIAVTTTFFAFPGQAMAKGYVLDYGVLQTTANGIAEFKVPSLDKPINSKSDYEVVATASELSPRIGLTMGFSWAISGLKGNSSKVKLVIKYPLMREPNGNISSSVAREYTAPVNNGVVVGVSGYGFTDRYALVAGDWEFEIEVDGQTVKKKFKLK